MSENINTQPNPSNEVVKAALESSSPTLLLSFKVLEYLSLAAAIGFSITSFSLPGYIPSKIGVAIFVSVFLFLFLVNIQLQTYYANRTKNYSLSSKALLRNISSSQSLDVSQKNQLTLLVEKALRYSQDLIDDYKGVRKSARNIYYTLQLATVVLSGVTPILVLVDKLEAGQSWLKWLPVICPAFASIIASIATSFAFQEKWTSANKAVELLEAEQEKFVLGVSAGYRDYDITEPVEREKTLRTAIGNFVAKVNNIHLKQIQADVPESTQEKKPQSSEPDRQKVA